MINVAICGFGNVGRAFAQLLNERADDIYKKYGAAMRCCAVIDIGGAALLDGEQYGLEHVLKHIGENCPPEIIPGCGRKDFSVYDMIKKFEPGVLIECTPTNIETGEPGLSHIRAALSAKWHVITANKGPLVCELHALRELAEKNRVRLKYSGATAAALPAIDVGLTCLAGTNILKIEGILNGTTNYILTCMSETGKSYNNALDEARKKGIAETNPTLDVEGWDTAVKILLLANSLFDINIKLDDIAVSGITDINPDDIRVALNAHKKIKLIGAADVSKKTLEVYVKPVKLGRSHPLYYVDGAEKGIVFTTDTMGKIAVSGGKSSPVGAAAALLKDIINIYRNPQ